jgi:hypothetical protein
LPELLFEFDPPLALEPAPELPLMPLLDPVVPLFIMSGCCFMNAVHCASLCIALGDMPWQRCIVA